MLNQFSITVFWHAWAMKSDTNQRPVAILLHQATQRLELQYENAPPAVLSAEFLRVNSPSAEVQGHSAAERQLVFGKAEVRIVGVHPVGNYAVLLEFDDGHRTGIYSFSYLQTLGAEFDQRFQSYEAELAAAGKSRFSSKE
jgi:DUF971 family protein